VLGRLVNMQFVRRDAGRYYLHQVDRDYALSRLPAGGSADRSADPPPFTQQALRHRGACYFEQTRTPRDDWKTLDDLAPQLAEFELRYEGADYDTAAQVLLGIDFDYLMQWGHYRLTARLHERLQDHLDDPWANAASKCNLGTCYRSLGQIPRAIELYTQALAIAVNAGDRGSEAVYLGALGGCHYEFGQIPQAIELYEQALSISCEVGYRETEANNRDGMGNCYAELGQIPRAIELYEQALSTDRKLGHRYGEAIALANLGYAHGDLGRWEQAVRFCRQAVDVADAIGSAHAQSLARRNLARVQLLAGDVPAASHAVDAARSYDYPRHRAKLSLLSGTSQLMQDQRAAAAREFQAAITQADEELQHANHSYKILDAKALALCGLALTIDPGNAAEAAKVFLTARAITRANGVINQNVALFNVLVTTDRSDILSAIRPAIVGRASGL
jgi:tetratricopeptide (TPR) repeat protein